MSRPRPKMVFDNPLNPSSSLASEQIQKPDTETESQSAKKPTQASRIGKRAVTFYIPDAAFRQLKILAAQTDRDIQDLMTEQLNVLFQQQGLARIAKE